MSQSKSSKLLYRIKDKRTDVESVFFWGADKVLVKGLVDHQPTETTDQTARIASVFRSSRFKARKLGENKQNYH